MKITNKHGINLALAVWLLGDDYDYVNKENYYSVTTLMKPLKQIILAQRVPEDHKIMDISELISSSLGSAIHDSIEKAWHVHREGALKSLGIPEDVRNRVLVNPTDEELAAVKNPIPIYFEQRAFREVNVDGKIFTIGGKFDLVTEGRVQDNKTTSVYTYIKNRKDDDYRFQLSSYKWLNPTKITEPDGQINFIFTDWQAAMARNDPSYPQLRLEEAKYDLLDGDEVEKTFIEKIRLIEKFKNSPEKDIPRCTDEELWRSPPVYKYYSDPTKISGRSTKNFDCQMEANRYQREKGKGVVIPVLGTVKACGYCPAFSVCEQKDEYLSE